jgi:hypothetical protein
LHLQPEGHVLDHGPVREQPKVLEDHRDGVAAELPQLGRACRRDVPAGDQNAAGSRLDQPDQRAGERRLPGAGEAHDDEDLAGPDLDRHVADRDDAARLGSELGARELGVGGAHDPVGVPSEDLPDSFGVDERLAGAIDAVAGPLGHGEHRLEGLRRGQARGRRGSGSPS